MPMIEDVALVTTQPGDDEMTAAQAAEALGLTDAAIRKAIRSGALPAVRRPLPTRPNAWNYWVRADHVARHRRLLDLRPFRIGRPVTPPADITGQPEG